MFKLFWYNITTIRYFIPLKILFSIFFVIGDFTLRLLKNIEKMILRKYVLSMLRVGQREKTNSVLTSS